MSDYIHVLTTCAKQDDAQAIARALVERRLAACVQVAGPIESIYRWDGKIETAAEWQCWIKTRHDHFSDVEAAIRELHSYEVPEILALPIIAGSQKYLDRLKKETSNSGGEVK